MEGGRGRERQRERERSSRLANIFASLIKINGNKQMNGGGASANITWHGKPLLYCLLCYVVAQY